MYLGLIFLILFLIIPHKHLKHRLRVIHFNVLLKLVLLELFPALIALVNVLRAPGLVRLDIALLNAHATAQRTSHVAVIDQPLQTSVGLDSNRKHLLAGGALLAMQLVEALLADDVAALGAIEHDLGQLETDSAPQVLVGLRLLLVL